MPGCVAAYKLGVCPNTCGRHTGEKPPVRDTETDRETRFMLNTSSWLTLAVADVVGVCYITTVSRCQI